MDIGVRSIFQNYRDAHEDSDVMRGELQIALLAEELGFDSYWATEHHFFGYSMCPDNVQWLSQIAGMTRRINLGTAAVIMPWNDPYRVAAKMALFDQQSGGRALLGCGMTDAEAAGSMRLVARDVVPVLRATSGARPAAATG